MKTARVKSGISQSQLGILAGIDEFCASARINQYERGKHTPDFLTAQHLAKVLGVPTAYFYTEDDNLAELIAAFGQMKISERKALIGYAESLINKTETHRQK